MLLVLNIRQREFVSSASARLSSLSNKDYHKTRLLAGLEGEVWQYVF